MLGNFKELIGKKVAAFRGMPYRAYKGAPERTSLTFMLFDDGETYIEFGEQDVYTFHDCDGSARTVTVQKNKDHWQMMMGGKNGYKEPDNLDSFPD